MIRNLLKILIAIIVLGYIFLSIVLYWLFWPTPTLVITNYDDAHPLQIINTTIHPGDRLSYVLEYCKYRDIPSTVHRTLIDGQVIILTDTQGALPMGCHKTVTKTAVIPETINPGRYYLDVSVIYRVNILRDQVTHYRTAYFDVTEGEPHDEATSTITVIE